MFITSLIKTFIYGGIIHLAMSYFFPKKYDDIRMNISYNVIYLYSCGCIHATKYLDNIKQYSQIQYVLDIIDKYREYSYGNIEVILDGKVFYTVSTQQLGIWNPSYYDFIIYSNKITANNNTSNKINKIIYHNIPITYEYTPCTYSFISVNVKILPNSISKNQEIVTYKLNFSNNIFNYYIVNNKINKVVLLYLLNDQHNVLYDNSINYSIDIIDHNANIISVDHANELIFNENDYIIVPYKEFKVERSNLILSLFNETNISDNIHFNKKPKLSDDLDNLDNSNKTVELVTEMIVEKDEEKDEELKKQVELYKNHNKMDIALNNNNTNELSATVSSVDVAVDSDNSDEVNEYITINDNKESKRYKSQ